MTESKFVVVFGIKNVDKVSIVRMNIIKTRETIQDLSKLFFERLAGVLNRASIEGTKTLDVPTLVTNSGGFTLSFRKDNINEV